MKYLPLLAFFGLSVVLTTGCSSSTGSATENAAATSYDGRQFLLTAEPDGAQTVIGAKEDATDGTPIVLVGRVGGSTKPWVEGRAAFMMIDPSMTVVADGQDSAAGELCLDDCCAQERSSCTTLVKVVDSDGKVVPVDARKLLGIKEADMVVVKGTAKKDEAGNMTLLATGVFVRE